MTGLDMTGRDLTADAGTAHAPPWSPHSWRLVLPDSWHRLDLAPNTRRRSARALAEQRVGPGDEWAPLRASVGESVLRTAEQAYDARAESCWLFTEQAGPLPLAASLTTFLTAAPHLDAQPTVDDLAARIEPGDDRVQVRRVDLPAGAAVRVASTTTGSARDLDGEELTSYVVQFYVPVPGAPRVLVLTFATPVVALAEAMGQLFDAIAASLVWEPG